MSNTVNNLAAYMVAFRGCSAATALKVAKAASIKATLAKSVTFRAALAVAEQGAFHGNVASLPTNAVKAVLARANKGLKALATKGMYQWAQQRLLGATVAKLVNKLTKLCRKAQAVLTARAQVRRAQVAASVARKQVAASAAAWAARQIKMVAVPLFTAVASATKVKEPAAKKVVTKDTFASLVAFAVKLAA